MNQLATLASRAAREELLFLIAGGHAVRHGHPGRIAKDAEDVIQLIRINRLDPESAIVRDLFEKHGTNDFYNKIKRACQGP